MGPVKPPPQFSKKALVNLNQQTFQKCLFLKISVSQTKIMDFPHTFIKFEVLVVFEDVS